MKSARCLLALAVGTLLAACQPRQATAPQAEDTASPGSPAPEPSPVTESPSPAVAALEEAKDQWREAHFDFLDLYEQAPSGPGGLTAYVRRTERQLRVVDRAFRRFQAEALDVLDAGGGPSGLREFLSVMAQWLDNQREQNEVFHRCGQDPQCIFVENSRVFEEGQRLSEESARLQQTDPELSAFLGG